MPPPTQFEIGRRTYYDFGPPFDFYEIYVVKGNGIDISIQRITLTPPGGSCMQPAKVESAEASVSESIDTLLGGENPCTIPEKELRREMKRCKKCLVFSGAVTTMQAQCGAEQKMIRAHVLDRDWFDSAPHTPKRTSWTMELLAHLDKAFESNVMDRPAFSVSEPERSAPVISDVSRDVSLGKYDALFNGAPHKPSDLYRAAQRGVPSPDIKVDIDTPVRPETRVQPVYPPLARMAHVEGKVVLKFKISQDGSTSNVEVESGHPMLRGAAEKAVNAWKFAEDAVGKQIEATIEFIANCPTEPAN